MNKRTAHYVLGIIDVASIYAGYHVLDEWTRIGNQIESKADQISIQAYFGLYALAALVPMIHAFSLFNLKDKAKQWLNRSLITLLLVLIINAFVLESQLKGMLTDAGYRYCQELSEHITFSEFNTYLSDNLPCQKH